jgi:hypothetical protein
MVDNLPRSPQDVVSMPYALSSMAHCRLVLQNGNFTGQANHCHQQASQRLLQQLGQTCHHGPSQMGQITTVRISSRTGTVRSSTLLPPGLWPVADHTQLRADLDSLNDITYRHHALTTPDYSTMAARITASCCCCMSASSAAHSHCAFVS